MAVVLLCYCAQPHLPPTCLHYLSVDVCKLDKVRTLNPPATYHQQCVTEARGKDVFCNESILVSNQSGLCAAARHPTSSHNTSLGVPGLN